MSYDSDSDRWKLVSSATASSNSRTGSFYGTVNNSRRDSITWVDSSFRHINTDDTARAIKQCDKFILTPYSNALKIIGWLPCRASRCGYAVQAVVVGAWFLCLLATMATQALSCFKRDALLPDEIANWTVNATIRCERHVISFLFLPDLVVLGAYLYGVCLFTSGGSDDLFSLASQVFIKNSQADSSSKKLIMTIQSLFILGPVWVVISLIVRIMTAIAVQLFNGSTIIEWEDTMFSGGSKVMLLVLSILGFLTFDALYMFSVLHYVAQAEMNIYLIWDVRRLIEIHAYDNIDGAIKETQHVKQYVDNLNRRAATLTSLALYVLISLALASIIGLDSTRELPFPEPYKTVGTASVFLNFMCWCLMISLPFIQATRVSYWCDRLKDLAPEIRGRVSAVYQDDPLTDLYSLLNYLHNLRLEAYLFGVPISPQLLYFTLTSFSFIMLVLFQNDVYKTKYI